MSADGSKTVAASGGPYDNDGPGLIWCSADLGTNWTQALAPLKYWTCVASSADGSVLIASAVNGFHNGGPLYGAIFVSTDFGKTWLERTPDPSWNSLLAVACSADANTLFAFGGIRGAYGALSKVFVSHDYAETWTTNTIPDVAIITAACSADGKRLIAAGAGTLLGFVLTSTNYGASWTNRLAIPFLGWISTASPASGDNLTFAYGSVNPGPIFVSTDSGEHSRQITNSGAVANNGDIALSAEENRAVLVTDSLSGGTIFTSSDSCLTWSQADAPITNWVSVASSADGCKLAAVVNGGGIYTWQTTPSPKLNITPVAGGLRISWIVPSMPFVLQETTDLNMPDWTAVPMTPILNLTNLHHEVTVPLSGTNRFYRLQNLE